VCLAMATGAHTLILTPGVFSATCFRYLHTHRLADILVYI
jgi:hypothetical protein